MTVPIGFGITAVGVAGIAAAFDVRTRTIPNRLTGPALALALCAHAATGGLPGALGALYGALLAGGLLMPGWLLGWMGAGDVKLMAAVGAWLAFPQSLIAVLASLIAGGVFAAVQAVRHRSLGRYLWGAAMLGAWAASGTGRVPPPVTSGIRFPFGAAIAAGTLATLWIRL